MDKQNHYFEVWVASPKFHKDTLLTYSFNESLESGVPVIIPLNKTQVPAVIMKTASKPRFKTKAIARVISASKIPAETMALAKWVKEYYPAPTGQIMSLFMYSSLVTKSRSEKTFGSSKNKSLKPAPLPHLTEEQSGIIKAISQYDAKSFILHGDTGSGKTRIYLELISKSMDEDKSSILLTPEIGLTPQLARDCQDAFPEKTVVVHSRLTPAEKREVWIRILEADGPLVIVGARSALFSPVKNLGAVIIDEFHESSYKQEQAPHYLATRIGAKLAKSHNAFIVLGSATPPVADYFAFENKKLPILRMTQQANRRSSATGKGTINIIDLKDRKLFSRSKWLCDEILKEVANALQKKQQSLIFLNRRGTARLIMCNNCAWQELCPNCDLPLTYHGDVHKVICHTCGHDKAARSHCPSCGSSDIIFRSVGTKALVAELEKLFPGAKIKRFDSDLGKSDRLEYNYSELKSGGYDIVVGTQMIGKGLDLPKLSVVGVVTADTSLSFPDYTSSERTFQLITQVLGRVNRGHLEGKAFVQTYYPDNQVIRFAMDKDYRSFYKSELKERKQYNFPPFCYTLKVSCSYAKREDAESASSKLALQLDKNISNVTVVGPSPKFIEKTSGRYRWQVIIKSKNRNKLLNIARQLQGNWSYDIDPVNLL